MRRSLIFLALSTLLALFAGGCATVGPDYQAPTAPAQEDYLEYEDPQLDSIVPMAPQWWKTAFNNPILNEIGILFLNPETAGQSARDFDRNIEKVAFRLELDNDKESIRRHLEKEDGKIVYDSEPHAGFWKKFGVWVVRLLPVESLL